MRLWVANVQNMCHSWPIVEQITGGTIAHHHVIVGSVTPIHFASKNLKKVCTVVYNLSD